MSVQVSTVFVSVAEQSHFCPDSAPDFFRLMVKNIGFDSTQKISAATGSGSEIRLVKICLSSAPDFDTKHLKNLNLSFV